MERITLNKVTSDLSNQLEFLIRREFFVTYYKYRKLPFYLAALTILIIALVMLTDADSFIILKALAVTIGLLIWAVALVFLISILIKRYNRNIWKSKSIKEFTLNNGNFQFAFDQEKLYFFGDKFSYDFKWDYYKYYAFYKGSIFIIPKRNIYESLFYSQTELGAEHYDLLKDIVTKKLVPIAK